MHGWSKTNLLFYLVFFKLPIVDIATINRIDLFFA
jgi:hypothetical protein